MSKVIVTTYSRTTPESVAEGDFSDSGWIDEEGESIEVEEGGPDPITIVAARWLQRKGAIEASSSEFSAGVWYSTEWSTVDFRTGEEEQRSFHLRGFTIEEEREVYSLMRA